MGVCDMLIGEQIAYLRRYYPTEWVQALRDVAQIAEAQVKICPCGAKATKRHCSNCRRYRQMVDREVAYKLRQLIPKRLN